jgi:hypothetical protein
MLHQDKARTVDLKRGFGASGLEFLLKRERAST